MATRLCAISIDLDEIRHYFAIHGLIAEGAAAHAVYQRALSRFADLAEGERLPLTFFVVGSDLERAENASRLRALGGRGHELGNHTFDHYYDLTRRSPREVRAQIERASEIIATGTGHRPTGFRAPGYTMSDAVYRELVQTGMSYSSSVFPCPLYHAAKALKLTTLRLMGKSSSSIAASPVVLAAPRTPYRVGEPYVRRGSGLLELPIQVTPTLRLPFIGTNLTLLGPSLARQLTRGLVGLELINLELHGIDLLDRHDGLESLARHQFDLRVGLGSKWDTLSAVVGELRRAGYGFVRLDEAARQFAARSS
jgi:peptidoglycan/xylan/chitin deacetylase (PgdA/CDA1 family)